MSATLWIDTGADRTVELGPTIGFYAAFAEMGRVAGPRWGDEWPSLFGVPTQVETQGDADPSWLADVRAEAGRFLARHRASLGAGAVAILELLKNAR